MKYAHLLQITDFLQHFKQLSTIKRVGDRVLELKFDHYTLFFDMRKNGSAIYKTDLFLETKEYRAPFDIALFKRANGAYIKSIETLKNNRVLKLCLSKKQSYKSIESLLYFEFTGRFTNVILCDEQNIIIEALSHTISKNREIKIATKFKELEPFEIKERAVEKIVDFELFFKNEYDKIAQNELDEIKKVKISWIEKRIEALENNIAALQKEEELQRQSDELSQKAALLTANLYRLKEYQREFSLMQEDGKQVKFSLQNSPKFEANRLFNESKKLRQKASGLKIEKQNLNERKEYFLTLKKLILNSQSKEEIEVLLPKRSGHKKEQKESQNIEEFYIKEYKVLVGKNAKGNETLLKNSKKDDFWLHLKDTPSAHVIIKSSKKNVDNAILYFAAKICATFSTKESGSYLVDYTKRANVKVVQGANVTYTDYKTIKITL